MKAAIAENAKCVMAVLRVVSRPALYVLLDVLLNKRHSVGLVDLVGLLLGAWRTKAPS